MANPGYVFINWTQYGMAVSTEPSFSITVTEGGTSNFEATSFDITQTTNFANGWSWWSGYIELDDSSLETLQNILGTSGMMIKSQNDGYVSYVSGYGWYGSLSSINNVSTYRVRATKPAPWSVAWPSTSYSTMLKPVWYTSKWSMPMVWW
ncbi:MAG: hypothetical protein IJP44_07255 [Bacteroidales bacterium]|nr:hypothetical protein [Bacteroidales bacterium]